MHDSALGFVGAGNMAGALIRGLVQSRLYPPERLYASDVRKEALDRLKEEFGIRICPDNQNLVSICRTVVLSVKPQNIKEALQGIREHVQAHQLVITIAAGIPISLVLKLLEKQVPVIRVMPNTPALVLKGASALCRGPGVGDQEMARALAIFGAVGETVEVDESLMDAVTALSGSGPGYVFRIMECLVEAGKAVGIPEKTALTLVIQTVLGAAHLAKESSEPLSRLREMVTSPGGTTAAGLAVLEEEGLEAMLKGAVSTAFRRSGELGRNLA